MTNYLKKIFIITISFMITTVNFPAFTEPLNVKANSSDVNELSEELREIAELHEKVIYEYNNQSFSKPNVVPKLYFLFVKCKNVTLGEPEKSKTYTFDSDSDISKVIDHCIKRFEERIEQDTNYAVDIIPTIIEVNDAISCDKQAFCYEHIKHCLSNPIPIYDYDSVCFISGQQGIYGVTYKSFVTYNKGLTFSNGESYSNVVNVESEMDMINRNASIDEELLKTNTFGVMTHEWLHQLDSPSKYIIGDERFPLCHSYQINGQNRPIDEFENSIENNHNYIKHPENGYKWIHEGGRGYYDAFLAGEIIDTLDGNKKKGMFPSLWKFICSIRLGTYSIKNVKTGKYLCLLEKDNGKNEIITVEDPDLSSKETQWNIIYDINSSEKGACKIFSRSKPKQMLKISNSSSFNIILDSDDEYQIKSNLNNKKGNILCEKENGTLEFSNHNKNNKWEIKRVEIESE